MSSNDYPPRDERGSWMRSQCYACGHTLRFESTGCPQCGEAFHGLAWRVGAGSPQEEPK